MTEELRDYYNVKALELDELAVTYESPLPYKRFFYRTRFERVLAALDPQPGEHVLEIGCGIGYYTRALLERGVRVTATEYAENYLRQAERTVGPEHRASATFAVEDAQALSFGEAAFDRVLMTEVIEHLPEPERALAEAARVLHPGGVAVVTTPSRFSPLNLAYALKRRIKRYPFNEHLHELTPGGFSRMVERHLELEALEFANFLFPYPLDGVYARAGSPGLEHVSRLEGRLASAPGLRRLGWTMIARARKSSG